MVMSEKKQAIDTNVMQPKKKEIDGKKMYVGPSIPGVAIQNVVYTRIPKEAAEVKKECPEFSNLFIPVRKYGMAEEMLRKREGYIFSAYQSALEYKERRKNK